MTEFATSTAPSRGGVRFRHIVLLLVLAFVGGAGASWWLADRYGWLEAAPPPAAPSAPLPAPAQPVAPLVAGSLPPSMDSAVASGNAARAEGLLVIFATRRAIENGAPLGYLTDQLRFRFGATQPQAVQKVLQGSQNPVTLQALRSDLKAIEPVLLTGLRNETPWATLKREFSELFVLRTADSLPPAPTQRMLRAQALVESGNLGAAVVEIAAMPGASDPAAQSWLARARTYDDVHKALDRLERSALAAPVLPPVAAEPLPVGTVEDLPTETVPE